jgi:hypothetical protein
LLLLSPVGYDEIDADLAAQAPDHLAFPAGVLLDGDQQMERGSAPESVWNLATRLMM